MLVAGKPEEHVHAARRNLERRSLFDHVAELGTYERFTRVGIASLNT
jgi:hypothetical protein